MRALYFLDDDQALLAVDLNRECRAGAVLQRRMAFFHRLFDILRVMVAATDDNQIFDAAGNE